MVIKAIAVIRGDAAMTGKADDGARGTVKFTQENESSLTRVDIAITVPPTTKDGKPVKSKRGFHIHAFGDNTNGCTSTGPHFNPTGKPHGDLASAVRHAGDMGNAECDENGHIKHTLEADFSLVGVHSVIGRSIVIHGGEDDLGLLTEEVLPAGIDEAKKKELLDGTKANGNAGGRIGCAVIGVCT